MTRRQLLVGISAAGAASFLPLSRSSARDRRIEFVRTADDRVEIRLPSDQRRFRILQVTDTHFGTNSPENRAKDGATRALIRQLQHTHKPDLILNTGDFVNNDKATPSHSAYQFMNDLGTPWGLVLGNHDHPNGQAGQLTLDQLASLQENSISGFAPRPEGGRDYCWRADLMQNRKSVASLFAFNTGDPVTGMIVNQTQTEWFLKQIEEDKRKAFTHPIYVMQHIPTVEFKAVFEEKLSVGRQGEAVCFELDKGEIFGHYLASERVKAIVVGHDHVNDYVGNWQGVRLIYGKCTGYSGYGDWQRGGRLLDINCETGRGRTRVVLGPNKAERPEWSQTLIETDAS